MMQGNTCGGKDPGYNRPQRGNVVETPELHQTTDTKLKRIAWLSARDPDKRFDCLMHMFNEQSLAKCFHELDGRKAVGVDGVTKEQYGIHLDQNLKELVKRLKRMAYRPGPVRQVLIPKDGKPGAVRPLGISNFEDKLMQGMMRKVLEHIYDPQFLECSYGFRKGRSCHDAIKDLNHYLFRHEVETVLDVDLAGYFDSIDHKLLLEMLREKVNDRRFLRYLSRMFKAGVLAENDLQVGDEGVPQGSLCSPVLANIFAHHVIDMWFEQTVKQHCRGRVAMFRYADDIAICCQYESDAIRVRKALGKRLARYRLRMNEEKTRLVPFSKAACRRGQRQGVFTFLGFTFYWGRSARNVVIPKVKTCGARLRAKLKRVNAWARLVRSRYPLERIWAEFCTRVRGHIQYYGVSFNIRALAVFRMCATRILFKWLNRRSQRRSLDWAKFMLFLERHPVPAARICHTLF